ncbi:MAG: hypoxanthine phosphoribosyltransferase [Eubacteriales bacterium]
MQLHPDVASVMYSAEEIRERISSLAAELKKEYADKNPLVVAILKGSVMFYADLTREMDFPLNMEFMSVSSYGSGTISRELRFRKDLDHPIEGRHVLLVEDIIDSGKTLYVLKNRLLERNPASVKICALLDKKARRVSPIDADYVGFPCEDEFVVGYGLDYDEKYRNLPYVGILKREVYEK